MPKISVFVICYLYMTVPLKLEKRKAMNLMYAKRKIF